MQDLCSHFSHFSIERCCQRAKERGNRGETAEDAAEIHKPENVASEEKHKHFFTVVIDNKNNLCVKTRLQTNNKLPVVNQGCGVTAFRSFIYL